MTVKRASKSEAYRKERLHCLRERRESESCGWTTVEVNPALFRALYMAWSSTAVWPGSVLSLFTNSCSIFASTRGVPAYVHLYGAEMDSWGYQVPITPKRLEWFGSHLKPVVQSRCIFAALVTVGCRVCASRTIGNSLPLRNTIVRHWVEGKEPYKKKATRTWVRLQNIKHNLLKNAFI